MSDNQSRQSFLGPDSDGIFASCKIGVVGASGGGNHIIQQTAHVGVLNYVVIDPKKIAPKHLHRIVGAKDEDVKRGIPKVGIAERLIKGIRPMASVQAFANSWQQ